MTEQQAPNLLLGLRKHKLRWLRAVLVRWRGQQDRAPISLHVHRYGWHE